MPYFLNYGHKTTICSTWNLYVRFWVQTIACDILYRLASLWNSTLNKNENFWKNPRRKAAFAHSCCAYVARERSGQLVRGQKMAQKPDPTKLLPVTLPLPISFAVYTTFTSSSGASSPMTLTVASDLATGVKTGTNYCFRNMDWHWGKSDGVGSEHWIGSKPSPLDVGGFVLVS